MKASLWGRANLCAYMYVPIMLPAWVALMCLSIVKGLMER